MIKKLPIKTWVHLMAFCSAAIIGTGSILNQSGPGGGYTNAPNESNCTSCHSGTLNPTPANLSNLTLTGSFTGGGYLPDSTYTLTVSYAQAGINKFGFQVTSLTTANNTYVGNFTAGTGNTKVTKTVSGAVRQYVQQNSSGTSGSGSKSWTFTWRAPNTNVDTISFYVTVNAANGNGQDSGDEIYAKVVKIPASSLLPKAIRTTSKPFVCAGDTVTYYASGTNSPSAYRWKFSFGFPSSTSAQNVVKAYGFPGTFYDTLWVSNNKGESLPVVNSIQVVSGTNAFVNSVIPNDTACIGSTITLTANTGSGLRYLWNTGNPADTFSTVDITQPGTYNVTVTNSAGCSKTSSDVNLTFVPVPIPTFSSSNLTDTICDGDTLKFTASAGFSNYDFLEDGISVQSSPSRFFRTSSIGKHNLRLRASNGFCAALSTDSIVKFIKARLPAPSINCTANTDTVFFTWNAALNEVYEVSEDGGQNWIAPNTSNGSHNIGGVGFSTKAEIWVRQIGSALCSEGLVGTTFCITDPCSVFNFDVSVSDSTFCIGTSTTISVSDLSPGNYTFSYNNATAITDSSFVYTPLTTDGIYTVAITDLNAPSCPPLKVIKNLYIDTFQRVNVAYSDTEFCRGETLNIQASSAAPSLFFLYRNNTIIDSNTSGNFNNYLNAMGLYNYTIGVLGDECLSLGTITPITVNGIFPATIRFTGSNREYVFYDSTQNGVSRLWTIGAGIQTDTNRVFPFNFTNNGTYNVQLISTDINTCIDTTNINVLAQNLGVKTNLNSKIKVYPNPASTQLNLKAEEEIKSIEIYTSLGQLVKTVQVNNSNKTINIIDLKPGVYLLKIVLAEEEGFVKILKE